MAGGIRESSGGDELEENHEINVTPFIDVMLVLLIIFMVAAPLATADVNVDLPGSSAPAANRQDDPVFLTRDGKPYRPRVKAGALKCLAWQSSPKHWQSSSKRDHDSDTRRLDLGCHLQ